MNEMTTKLNVGDFTLAHAYITDEIRGLTLNKMTDNQSNLMIGMLHSIGLGTIEQNTYSISKYDVIAYSKLSNTKTSYVNKFMKGFVPKAGASQRILSKDGGVNTKPIFTEVDWSPSHEYLTFTVNDKVLNEIQAIVNGSAQSELSYIGLSMFDYRALTGNSARALYMKLEGFRDKKQVFMTKTQLMDLFEANDNRVLNNKINEAVKRINEADISISNVDVRVDKSRIKGNDDKYTFTFNCIANRQHSNMQRAEKLYNSKVKELLSVIKLSEEQLEDVVNSHDLRNVSTKLVDYGFVGHDEDLRELVDVVDTAIYFRNFANASFNAERLPEYVLIDEDNKYEKALAESMEAPSKVKEVAQNKAQKEEVLEPPTLAQQLEAELLFSASDADSRDLCEAFIMKEVGCTKEQVMSIAGARTPDELKEGLVKIATKDYDFEDVRKMRSEFRKAYKAALIEPKAKEAVEDATETK